ncbi:hypothetical protein ABIA45_005750 [Bradyrhizobium sp. USDA 336]
MDSSFDDPDYDYAASVAGRAMRSMAEQRIAPTPANFAVWSSISRAAMTICATRSIS